MQACFLNKSLNKALALHDKILTETDCQVDEKFYAVLAKGCLQMRQPLKAVEVVRAAYQLPGHSLAKPAQLHGRPIGVEMRVLEEVVAKLQAGAQKEQDALVALTADLTNHSGIQIGGGDRGPRRRSGHGRAHGGNTTAPVTSQAAIAAGTPSRMNCPSKDGKGETHPPVGKSTSADQH